MANGGRTLFTRDVASVTMDLNDVEAIEFRALGGADNITVGDLLLARTCSGSMWILRGPNGGTDQAVDTVTVNATQGADVFGVTGDTGGVRVFGLPAEVNHVLHGRERSARCSTARAAMTSSMPAAWKRALCS